MLLKNNITQKQVKFSSDADMYPLETTYTDGVH